MAAACYVVVDTAGGVVGVGLDPNGPPTFPTRAAAARWAADGTTPEPRPWRVATVREVYGPPSSVGAVDEAAHLRAG